MANARRNSKHGGGRKRKGRRMNKRQAKKRRKKQIDDGLNAAIICAERLGKFLKKWMDNGMPIPTTIIKTDKGKET